MDSFLHRQSVFIDFASGFSNSVFVSALKIKSVAVTKPANATKLLCLRARLVTIRFSVLSE